MYFSKLRLQPNQAVRVLGSGEYHIHQSIWKQFADSADRKRDFLYRRINGSGVVFLTLSERKPDSYSNLWEIETKPFNPQLRAGQTLGFSLRANPVRTGKNANGKHTRFDVVMDEKVRLRKIGTARKDWPALWDLMQKAGEKWLKQREDRIGVNIDRNSLRADGYRQIPFYKKGHRIKIATLDFEGVLTVTDPEKLKHALFNGIGPAKAFGCGLLLVRRI